MANTVGGALKAYIESLGLNVTCFRDRVTPDPTTGKDRKRPYIVISDEIANTPYAPADRTRQLAQVDLWFDFDSSGAGKENTKLADDLLKALNRKGALVNGTSGVGSYGTPPRRIYGLACESKVRIVEEDTGLIHHAYTVAVPRAL